MKTFSLIGECAAKSELVHGLVVELTSRGLRVSTIKRIRTLWIWKNLKVALGSIARLGPRRRPAAICCSRLERVLALASDRLISGGTPHFPLS